MADTVEGAARQRGLWREEFEHDACGIGALASIKGVRTHQMLGDALSRAAQHGPPRRRRGSSAPRATAPASSSRSPTGSSARRRSSCGRLLPDEGNYGVAMLFLPRDAELLRAGPRARSSSAAPNCGHARAVLARGARRRARPGRHRARLPAAHLAGVRAQARPRWHAAQEFERALYLCRRSMEKRAAAPGPARARRVLRLLDERAHHRLQGHAAGGAAARVLPRPLRRDRSRRPWPWCTRATPPTPRRAGNAPTPTACIVHNGEINTLRGNVNWIRARRAGAVLPRHRRPGAGAAHRRPRGQRLGDPGQRGASSSA